MRNILAVFLYLKAELSFASHSFSVKFRLTANKKTVVMSEEASITIRGPARTSGMASRDIMVLNTQRKNYPTLSAINMVLCKLYLCNNYELRDTEYGLSMCLIIDGTFNRNPELDKKGVPVPDKFFNGRERILYLPKEYSYRDGKRRNSLVNTFAKRGQNVFVWLEKIETHNPDAPFEEWQTPRPIYNFFEEPINKE